MKKSTIALGALAALGVQAAAGTNLLVNPGFETPGPGVIPFAGWTDAFFGNVSQSSEIAAHEGGFVAKMFGTFPGPGIQGDTGVIQRVDGAVAGEEYTASIWSYVSGVDALAAGNFSFLILQFQDVNDNLIGEVVVDAANADTETDVWRQHVASGVAPAGTTSVRVLPLMIQLENGGGAVFFDDASLVQGAPPAQPCNIADVAEPYGILDLNDISSFISAFTGGCP